MKLGGKDMLKQAQPHFETFKALFTHGVLGISRAGRPIWVMRVGILHLRPSELLRHLHSSGTDLLNTCLHGSAGNPESPSVADNHAVLPSASWAQSDYLPENCLGEHLHTPLGLLGLGELRETTLLLSCSWVR